MTIAPIVVAAAIVLLVANSLGLLALAADVGRLSLRLDPARSDLPLVPNEGLTKGELLPELSASSFPTGQALSLNNGPRLFVFISSGCAPCRELSPSLVRFARLESREIAVVAVVADDPVTFLGGADLVPDGLTVIFDRDGQISSSMKVRRTPFAYFIVDGIVKAKGVVNRFEHLVTLTQGHSTPAPASWTDPGPAGTALLGDEVN